MNPLWSQDGRELFYRNGDEIIVVKVETDPTFKPGKPELLFQGPYFQDSLNLGGITSWDIDQNGKRFLMLKEVEATKEDSIQRKLRKINIVLNWFEELKQKVPAD